ncbi:MAG: Tad domain-containing protein [Sulfuricella sp.]|nr:Tad domain-containing protein [Sulfuricella sp.]
MKTGTSLKNRQGGAVAVMVGFSLVLLIGFLAMVIDLGHLYLAKTELQNAADAAALSGVKQLNGTKKGVDNTDPDINKWGAVQWAEETAAKNSYDFSSKPVDIDINDIWVGNCPEDSCMVAASSITTDAAAAGRTFLKVHTRNRDLVAWFAPIWNIFHVSTYGVAVAGPLVRDISPLGVCALAVKPNPDQDPNKPYDDYMCGGPGNECGFLRGVAYNVPEVNPIGLQAHPLLINPVDVPPGNCDPSNGAADFMRPFICQGKAVGPSQIPGEIYANTGGSWGPVEAGLNSRFDLYPPSAQCDAATAPPDANIKQYAIGGGNNQGRPRDWMNPDPTGQVVEMLNRVPTTYNPNTVPRANGTGTPDQWGVLWSYIRERNFGSGTTGPDYNLSDWLTLYSGAQADITQTPPQQMGYPLPGGTPTPPYQYGLDNPSSKYFEGPSAANSPGKVNRRVLNLLIIDCNNPAYPVPGPGASCARLDVIGIGKFFMQIPADSSGSPKKVYGEFAGLLPPGLLKPQYVLFK